MANYEMEVWGIAIDPINQSPIVVLRNKENPQEVLPIWIGHTEASGIIMVLNNIDFVRPLTYDLVKSMVESLGAKVEKVEISDIKDGTFYATVYLRDVLGNSHELDARPSDAINLALRFGAPIYASEKVMNTSKVVIEERFAAGGEEKKEDSGETEKFKSWLESIKPEDFENFGKKGGGEN